jgi:hypothetical protein
MSIQNRQFFRKKLKLKPKTSIKVFSKFTSNKNSQKRKLSPHKWLKNIVLLTTPTTTQTQNLTKFCNIQSYVYNILGQLDCMILSSSLGINFRVNGILGSNFTTIFILHRINQFNMVTPFKSLDLSSPHPIIHLSLGSREFFTRQTAVALMSYDNQLLVPSKNISASGGSFIVGLSSLTTRSKVQPTSIVRGIAKNPVDHPNGGRANTKGSFKTP